MTDLLPITHVLPLAAIRRERRLAMPGVILARVNQKVQAQDVIGEADHSLRHILIDLARGLGVREKEVDRYLIREKGDRLEQGDIIAGPVGFARRTVRAPRDGRVASILDGQLLFEALGEPYRLRAGLPGTVVATDETRSVTIEASGALVQAVWGNGRQDFGVMRVVCRDAADRLQTDELVLSLRGAVIVACICDHPAALHQAREMAVRGLVLSSMASDLIPLAQRMPYPIVLIEGFGEIPLSSPAFRLLSSNNGREAAVDARPWRPYEDQRPEVIIPLPTARTADLPDEFVQLEPRVQVRVLRAPYQGAMGVIQDVMAQGMTYPSGVLARSAKVDLEGFGLVTVPIANLEALR